MVGEHDWGGLVEWHRDEAGGPFGAGGDGICGVCDDVAWEAFEAFIEEGECHGRFVMADNCPVALIVAHRAAMKGVMARIFVLRNVRSDAVNSKRTILYAIRVASDNRTIVGVYSLGVMNVGCRVVVAEDDVLRSPGFVVYEEVSEARAVRDKGRIYARSNDGVLGERGGDLGGGSVDGEEGGEAKGEEQHFYAYELETLERKK